MEMNSKQREFILLRADGLSFDKLAIKLKVSKASLIQWSKLFEEQIKEVQFEAFIGIKELYSWNTKTRYTKLLEQLKIIDDGIKGSDLTKSTIKDLFTIKNDILMQLDRIEAKIKTDPKIKVNNEFGFSEDLEFKLNEI